MPLSTQKTQDIQKQFDPMRARIQRQEAAALQGERDALARRAAQLGGGPGGALIKQEGMAADRSAQRMQQANEGVDAQQQATLNQAREVQEQRDYLTGERVAGQQFSTSERLGSQDFANLQRLGSQDFARSERLGSQGFATSERLGSQAFTAAESAMARALQRYGIDVNKALQEGQLMGTYGGKSTLAATTAADQKAFQKQVYDDSQEQLKKENEVNLPNTLISTMSNLKTLGYSPEQITALFSSLGLDKLFPNGMPDIPGVTTPFVSEGPGPLAPVTGATGKTQSAINNPFANLGFSF